MARLLVSAVVVLLAGCAAFSPRGAQPPAADVVGRPPDGLLVRPDLQVLVDAQVRREGATLVRALAHRDSVVRARAAFALGSVQDPSAAPALAEALADAVPAVRADAAFALGQLADSTYGPTLLAALRTEGTPGVQAELLDALGRSGLRPDLDRLLEIPLPPTAEAARARALGRFTIRGVTSPRAFAWLAERLRAPDAALREAAAYPFSRTPPAAWGAQADALRGAFDALAGDAARMHLARALGRRAEAADVPRLASALAQDPDWRTRVAAAGALGAQGAAAHGALVTALADPHALVAQTAAEALVRAAGTPPPAGVVDAAARIVADGRGRPTVQGALLPLLARDGRTAAVVAWAERQTDPFARASALSAYGVAPDAGARDRLFAAVGDTDALLASAAVEGLKTRWEVDRTSADAALIARYYGAFETALARRDLATTTAAAPALSDSLFTPLGAGALLRRVYGEMSAPVDVEPMTEIVRAMGDVRDGSEIDFLVGVAMAGHPVLRAAARDALNERLIDGIDVSLPPDSAPTTGPTTSIDWRHLGIVGAHPRLMLETTRGRIVVEMDTETAPQTVQLLTTTAARSQYDGVPFHRVVPNFVVQGGDFYRADGYGGPDVPIRSEFSRTLYRTGTVGIASAGKDTEGVQFFLTHSPQPHLDARYTVVGRVVSGQDVVDQMVVGDVVRRAWVVPDRNR